MTAREYRTLFESKTLIVNDNYYHFDNKGNYLLAKGEDSINGTYHFRQSGDQVYLKTKPPIYPDQGEEVEVTLYLGTHQVLFVSK
jgi:hypothetical protein